MVENNTNANRTPRTPNRTPEEQAEIPAVLADHPWFVGHSQWASKSPDEILADINAGLTSVWSASAWAVTPKRILIPPPMTVANR
jgi:hypothetical protein